MMPPYPTLSMTFENLKSFEVRVGLSAKILLAKTYVKAIITVAAIFIATKTPMFVFTTPAITGLSSEEPENDTPNTVVKQSNKPVVTSKKIGTICNLVLIKTFFALHYCID
jgi:hypothetical protein